MLSDTDGAFGQEVPRLRVEYQRRRQASNLYPPAGQPEDSTPLGRYVRLFDLPGTLSGDILRLNRDLPSLPGHFEIEGDVIRPLEISCALHLIHLLGASATGDLVFEKLATRGPTLGRFSTLAAYKRWLLHLLDALAAMHAAGIVHRDLRVDNLTEGRARGRVGGESGGFGVE
ncbi:hypothetical protein BT67DRAFT_456580 [Trichocladium antarcticum]|uniref:Protein kinase domain-containing protein n=1 Tax=Trichocladium antarcticum TaxID=1450529 RepID=A0AAN6UIV6_9PEZI|nr:hypothetical protein BT67DRAFT_456580 [Trichocladium antarcticum]